MEPIIKFASVNALCTVALIALMVPQLAPVSGQVTTACTTSLLSSLSPCLGYLAGNGTGSPTAACCRTLSQFVSISTGCACLIVTGNIPFNLPINRTLAVSLPRVCNSTSVRLRCSATTAETPSASAVPPSAFTPSLSPLPPLAAGPTPSQAFSQPPPSQTTPTSAAAPTAGSSPAEQGTNQVDQRPTVLPSSAAGLSYAVSPFSVLVLVLAALLFV